MGTGPVLLGDDVELYGITYRLTALDGDITAAYRGPVHAV